MSSNYRRKKKHRTNRRRGGHARQEHRLPRWCTRIVLPLVLVLCLAGLIFPSQTDRAMQLLSDYVADPVSEHVLHPFLLDPLEEHVVEPIEEHILQPIQTQFLQPINRYVIRPLNRYVWQPLQTHVLRPAGRFLHDRLWEPFRRFVLYPISSQAQALLETKLFSPLGIPSPWKSGSPDRIPTIDPGSAPGSSEFEVHFLDVGQGLSVLVRSGKHALLYDGGDRETSSFVVSYLKSHGVTSLDYMIASHYDADHLSGLIGVLRTIPVDTILGPDYVHDSKTYTAFQNAVSALQKDVLHPAAGSEYRLGDAYFTVLGPEKISSEPNNNSVAIRLINGENSFLLSGDAEEPEEEAMCSSGLTLYSDVICPGHHGSSTATTGLFLSCTQPEWAVISVGADNDYGHPHAETLQRLADAGVQVLRTDEHGTVIAKSDGKKITWSTER